MKLLTCLLGSVYIMRSIFRFSYHFTNFLFTNNIIDLHISKFEKINELIYSSIHGSLVSGLAILSIKNSIFQYNLLNEQDNQLQYLTTSLCFSYFLIDVIKCLYNYKYLYLIHHLVSLYLLLFIFNEFNNIKNKGFYAMYLIFLLESNTILLNIGFLLKEFKFHYSITCTSWILHLVLFVLFRLITIPRILFIYYYNEPITINNLLQIPAFILILSGSVYWSYRQTIGITKYLKENSVI